MAIFLGGAVGVIVLGTIQWLLLSRWVSKSSQWILGNAMGVLSSVIVGITIHNIGLVFNLYMLFLVALLVVLIYTAITGAVLTRLLRYPIAKP
ncbi:MAG: hypothetical protein QNJ51_05810 [Calothrix sp. MO_167.B12]|nr:hypothetical protein [Calothrix sp. MO_167.B12]